MMETWIQDVRYGTRSLRRSLGFTVVAVAVLGAGIGATTTIFSGVHAVLLAPLPFDEPERLVGLWERNPDFGWEQAVAAPANMLDWRERVEAFDDVAGYRDGSVEGLTWIDDQGEPRRVAAVQVTGNLFDVLGLRPHLGTFPSFDDTWAVGEPWAVVSHAFWTESLGADPGAVGRTLDLDGVPVRVRAVLGEGVRFPTEEADLWTSYRWERAFEEQAWFRRAHFVTPVARLARGATVEQARAQLDAVALQLQEEHPDLNTNMFAGLTPLRERLVGDLAGTLRLLMMGVGVLLLLACVNVGNLFLVRAVSRTGELSVRRAVGAGTGRIVRQLLAEALLVGVAGGIVGLALALVGIRLLGALRPLGVAGTTAVELDAAVFAFGVTAALGATLLFGLVPALRAARGAAPVGLAGGRGAAGMGRGRRDASPGLVPVQTALAVVLVLAAILVTRSFVRLQAEDAGIDPAGVWAFSLTAPADRYPDGLAVLEFWDDVVERVEAVPGVERAAVTGGVPLTGSGWTSQLVARDWEAGRVAMEVRHRASTPGYFDVMGVPLLAGRAFEPGDGLGPPYVAIVNRAFVDAHFDGEDAIGREVTFDRVPTENSIWRTVVGVVGDERQIGLSQPPAPEVWEPFPQDWGRTREVALKVDGDPGRLREALAGAVALVDPGISMGALRSMDDVVSNASADARFLSLLFGLFATLAVVLAGVGIFGVTAQVVRRRVPEFGIRLALGAEGRSVAALVVGRTLALAGAGVLVGSLLALVGAGLLESLLYDVGARDPVSFVAAPVLLLGVAVAAAVWPAARAARVDPVRSLRAE